MVTLEAWTKAELIAIILRPEERVARLEKRVVELEAENAANADDLRQPGQARG